MAAENLVKLYDRYLERCNAHEFDALAEFVAEDVTPAGSLDAYIEGLRAVVAGFPDYRWEKVVTIVQGDRLAVRLWGQGTHMGTFRGVAPSGRTVRTPELVMYRFRNDQICECWGDLGSTVRDALVSGSSE